MFHNKDIVAEAKKYVNTILISLDDMYYHQYSHTLDVVERAVYLGYKENLSREEIEILELSALFHDTGFIVQYEHNEPIGAKFASNFLKSYLYPNDKIATIERIILATDPNYLEPKDIYEKIIKDADVDNLGRDDFFEQGSRVKSEVEVLKNIKIKDPEWHHAMLDVLYKNKFYTNTQIEERQQKKDANIALLESKIERDDMKKDLNLTN
jgi:predicted metal-dependent HD superfamily phosphohydrolase